MAQVPVTSKNVLGQFTPSKIAIATSGDTLVYSPNAGQELLMYNSSASDVVVTIDGANGTTVPIVGAGNLTASVAAGLAVTVTANSFSAVRLDTIPLFLQGAVSITAATGAVVMAAIIQ